MALLMPPGVAPLAARLVSARASLDERLVEYLEDVETTLAAFANAPLGAIGFACTGSSYLAGRARERKIVAGIEAGSGRPFITAGNAVAAALRALGAGRVALVSPYPDSLTAASVRYWGEHGFEVARVASVAAAPGESFHPIYGLRAAESSQALSSLAQEPVPAIVMLGTGLPTLGPLLAANRRGGPLALSCMLCLAWRLLVSLGRLEDSRDSLEEYARGAGWETAFARSTGESAR
jgi:maleate cis-trans isomerase